MKRVLVLLAVVCGTVALGAAPASAHASLQGTDPSQSAQLPSGSPPAAVTLRFDQGVAIPAGAVQVFDGTGKVVKIGAVVHGESGSVVTASLPRLADGTYVVTWRVVSDDSHPVQGAFTFGVGRAAGTTANVRGLLSSHAGSRTIGVLFGLDRAVAFLSLLGLLGGIASVRWWWPEAGERRDVTHLLLVALGAVVVTSLAGLGFQAAYATGRGFAGILDPSAIRGVLHTRFGEAWLARAVFVLALLPTARAPRRKERRGVDVALDVLLVITGVVLCGTFTYAGHGDTGRLVALGFVTDLVHLVAASVWLGGVAVLALALRDPEQPRGAARATARFSAVAVPAIFLVALSGSVQAWRQIGTWAALWHTVYARLLLAKVLLVGVVVVAASASRDILRQRVVPAIRVAVGPGAARREAVPEDVRDLRNSVWVEIALAAVVLAITAGLVNAEPAREAAAATPRTYATTLRTNDMWFDVAIQPTLPGANTIVITPRTPRGGAAPVVQLDGTLAVPGRVAPIPLAFAPVDLGRYVGTAQVPIAGRWVLDIRALRTQTDRSGARVTIRFG